MLDGGWLQPLKERPLPDLAAQLGLEQRDRGWGPCPSCGAEKRGRRGKRGPVGIDQQQGPWLWGCVLCGKGGSGLDLLSWRFLQREPPAKGDRQGWRELYRACQAAGLLQAQSAPPLRPPPSRPAPVPEPHRPDPVQVKRLWGAAGRVDRDGEAARWLEGRGLDPAAVAAQDLGRVLPWRLEVLPRWARFQGIAWTDGWRLVLPAFGAAGAMESLRARALKPPPDDAPSGLAAAAGEGSARAMVLADRSGQHLLRTGRLPEGVTRVVVCEGESDFLTWATQAAESTAAVLGVWAGAWSEPIALRIPVGTPVALWTDLDLPGERYALQIARTLHPRCPLVRRPHLGGQDANDLLRGGRLPADPFDGAEPITADALEGRVAALERADKAAKARKELEALRQQIAGLGRDGRLEQLSAWEADEARLGRLAEAMAIDSAGMADALDRLGVIHGLKRRVEALRLRLQARMRRGRGSSPPPPPDEHSLDEVGNAMRLQDRFGSDMRFWRERQSWLVWSGKRWEENPEEAMRRAIAITDGLMRRLEVCEDPEERKELKEFVRSSRSRSKLQAALGIFANMPGVAISAEELDTNPWLMNVANGTIDLRTGELRPHSRGDLCTRLVDIPYRPEATCPRWTAFLHRIFAGDAELIGFLQRAVGYSLTGFASEQMLLILHGEGANGKSTFLSMLSYIAGGTQAGYARTAEMESFTGTRGEQASNDLARLAGARVVVAEEGEQHGSGGKLNEALIKKVTGGVPISARFLYREFFEFTPQFQLWLATNHRPQVRGRDHGLWRRLKLVPFEVTIPREERDPLLLEKLKAEAAGILAWAVAGCVQWQASGLREPAAVQAATDAYREESDPLAGFIEDCCAVDANASAPSSVLYAAYTAWCQKNGEYALSQRRLGPLLRAMGFLRDKLSGGGRLWRGLRVISTLST